MYTLYYLPNACSLATLTVLLEMDEPVSLINKNKVTDFSAINPVGNVPVLIDEGKTLKEGAAIMLYLLRSKANQLFPQDKNDQQKAIQDIMFANATMHPAYGRLFFISQNMTEGPEKDKALNAAANAINSLWESVEVQLENHSYLGGESVSAADIMLAVYSRWSEYFPVKIKLGSRTTAMLNSVMERPTFKQALLMEAENDN
ncbi:glutathione S-transferase family protein [Neptuniibacter sp. QD37_6]|uniref:glutathione S-transferase family protein n=1 Tax=Neptuniibacter sp. QD37_6 TaxID=3398210 RepID=UPI0039F5E3C9